MFGPSKKELLKRIKVLEEKIDGKEGYFKFPYGTYLSGVTPRWVGAEKGLIKKVEKQQALLNEIIDTYYGKKKKRTNK